MEALTKDNYEQHLKEFLGSVAMSRERALDAWLAEHAFGFRWVAGEMTGDLDGKHGDFRWLEPPKTAEEHLRYDWMRPACGEERLAPDWEHDVPRYQGAGFRLVKREIERRGWNWRSESHSDGWYWFRIWKQEPTDDPLQMKVTFLGEGDERSEELAGCLAFKAAVGSTDA